MSRISFDNYARLAKTGHSETVVSGRYSIQRAAERLIPIDVAGKLGLTPGDSLLEIGCGPGSLLIPLSFLVESSMGVDSSEMVARVKQRFPESGLDFMEGNFLDLRVDRDFSKILIYSVLHNLSDHRELFLFLEKAVSLLRRGGRMLLGDLPNQDLKARFLDTEAGERFLEKWNAEMEASDTPGLDLAVDNETFSFSDELISKIVTRYNEGEFRSSIMDQRVDLPFGHTRQDLLICRMGDAD